jgi:hypothetical protein
MPQAVYVAAGAALAILSCLAAGRLMVDRFGAGLPAWERWLVSFPVGAACLHLLVFLLAAGRLARKGVLISLGVALILAAWRWRRDAPAAPSPRMPRAWTFALAGVFAVFGGVYLVNAMAREHSPDGVTYHLGLVARYLRERGFRRLTTNMYASLSQGVEMLYLMAFSVGKHSAAALTHLAFLFWLPAAMLTWARREGVAAAGAAGAAFVFLSPVVGRDGTTAYNDVAVAAVLFAVFWLVDLWRARREDGLLVLLGLMAGFGYAAKYTAFLAVPYTLGVVAWTLRGEPRRMARAAAMVGLCAFLMMAPWMAKNALWVGNPLAPFFNAWFPNPHVHVSFEQQYGEYMRAFGDLKDWRAIPFELTVRGGLLAGLLGPLFLLAPVGLLAAREAAGRRVLLAAAVFAAVYPANIGTRFLIPCLPFVALALALAFRHARGALGAMAAFHALTAWPWFIGAYSHPAAWRLTEFPWRAALRLESEDDFLTPRVGSYPIARLIDRHVPARATVFAFTPVAEAYCTRNVPVAYQSAWGESVEDIFRTALYTDYQPKETLRFRFAPVAARGIRVVQTAAGGDIWSVSELRLLRGGAEIPRGAGWRLRARPNPGDVQAGCDNSPLTRWRSWQAIRPGMFVEAEFGGAETLDAVHVERVADQYQTRLKVEAMEEGGRWRMLSDAPEIAALGLKAGLKREAMREIKLRGVDYVVMFDSDYGWAAVAANPGLWGLSVVGDLGAARLYRID